MYLTRDSDLKEYSNTRETLLMKLRDQQNEFAWSEFFEIYNGFIFAILIKMSVPAKDQEDLVQDILLKAWKNLPKFQYERNRGKFRNWLGIIVKNTARSYYRKMNNSTKNLDKIESDEEESAAIDAISEKEWKLFIANKAWENIKTSLSENVIECFELISEGLELQEVAKRCDIPYNTVCVYKRRIVNKISREINRLDEDLG